MISGKAGGLLLERLKGAGIVRVFCAVEVAERFVTKYGEAEVGVLHLRELSGYVAGINTLL